MDAALAWIMWFRLDLLGELVLAVLIGGAIGLEREASGKPAGLRTTILICLGATLITDVSLGLGAAGPRADGARLAAQIVSGVGFLGAGTIMQARGTVTGLTSAATLWVVAAIGIAIGSRHTVEAIGTAFLVLVILLPMGELERRMSGLRRSRTMTVELHRHPGAVEAIAELVRRGGLAVRGQSSELDGDKIIARFDLVGPSDAWRATQELLLTRNDVRAMRVS
jgi:putative Mg2+ transporter-C (MgtC) family protein